MSDATPMFFALGFLFFGGFIMSVVVGGFVDIEEQTTDTWVEPFAIGTSAIFKFITTPLIIIQDTYSSIGRLFGTTEPPDMSITIDGTGSYEGNTLDGDYIYDQSWTGEDRFIHNTDDDQIIVVNYEDNEVNEYYLTTNEHLSFISRLLGLNEIIYVSDGASTSTWTLNRTEYDYNPTATGTEIIEENGSIEPPTQTLEFVSDEITEKAENSIRVFGLLPVSIGLPIILLSLLAIIYSLIKLIPFT